MVICFIVIGFFFVLDCLGYCLELEQVVIDVGQFEQVWVICCYGGGYVLDGLIEVEQYGLCIVVLDYVLYLEKRCDMCVFGDGCYLMQVV